MGTVELIIIVIAFILLMLGVIFIYDARKLTKKLFGFQDQNEGSKWFKIGGFIICIIGILMLYFTLN